MPNAVDGVAEDQVLQTAVAVRSHDDKVGLKLAREFDDLVLGTLPVNYGKLGGEALVRQRGHNPVEILFARLHFGVRGDGAEQPAGGAFFDVQQV